MGIVPNYLNPIEHLWDNLDTCVRQRQNPPGKVNELRDALLEEWNNIPQTQINNLIHSMRSRCQAVSNARGGHTRSGPDKSKKNPLAHWASKLFFFTCPAQIPTCPGVAQFKFLYTQDLQTEIGPTFNIALTSL